MMRFCAIILTLLIGTEYIFCEDVLLVTVATKYNDALKRFLRSAESNDFRVEVLGLGRQWKGGNVSKYIGGGQKVNILKEYLGTQGDRMILFVDSYDVVIMDSKDRLMEEYKKIGSNVLFSAEDYCWPQKELEQQYTHVGSNEKRFLNSGAFMGPASALYKIVSMAPIKDDEDDQLYYTKIFLDPKIRKELGIALDTKAAIFQNLHGALSEVQVNFTDTTGYLNNTKLGTIPIIAHGNGPIKAEFNSLTNYLDYSWTPTQGCQHCSEDLIDMKLPQEFPIVQMSIFVERPTPFLDIFFERIAALTYPKNRIHLTGYLSKQAEIQRKFIDSFVKSFGNEYLTNTWFASTKVQDEGAAHDVAAAHCLAIEDCQFMFVVDGSAQLTENNTLEQLVHMNRSMIAPLLARRGKLWSNFWGALSTDGYYERSDDYMDILNGIKKGIWNVPFVRDVYLMSRWAVKTLAEVKFAGSNDTEMDIAHVAREKYVFMVVDNQQPYGYLINTETTAIEHANDLRQIFDNPLDWEEQYVHPEYFALAEPDVKMEEIPQICSDVFYIPLLSRKMCKQLVEEVANSELWSDGTNVDPRLEGGYENVPTRDIHMRQIGWEDHWLHFLVKYVHPIQKKIFVGYDDKPWARMNFIVRYKPDEQPSLKPHHDASSYTLNIALNEPEIDFQGGGTRFIRYNCSLTTAKLGWATISPGRVTHLHEGLTTISGTRYIFITFVNP